MFLIFFKPEIDNRLLTKYNKVSSVAILGQSDSRSTTPDCASSPRRSPLGIASGQTFARQFCWIVAAPVMAVPYTQQRNIERAVRRSSKRCWHFMQHRCIAGTQCHYSHRLTGELDEGCLRRSMAELGVPVTFWARIIHRALELVKPVFCNRRQVVVSRIDLG